MLGFLRRRGGWLVPMNLLAGVLAARQVVADGEATDSLRALEARRDALAGRLEQRLTADGAGRELQLTLDRGVDARPLTLRLCQRGSASWHARLVGALKPGLDLRELRPEALAWQGDRLSGDLVLVWREQESDETAAPDAPSPDDWQVQRFTLDARVAATEPQWLVTFHRLVAGRDCTLVLDRGAGNDADAWGLSADNALWQSPYGLCRLTMAPLRPDAEGRVKGRIEFTAQPGRPGNPKTEAWVAMLNARKPIVEFEGRLIEDRLESTYVLTAPGGKHLFGSARDRVSGFVRREQMDGRYASAGARGVWTGRVSGPLQSGADRIEPPTRAPAAPLADALARARRAAALYRDICALERAWRDYPIPFEEAWNRAQVPAPATGADEAALSAYLAALDQQAGRILAAPAGAPADQPPVVAEADPGFGPYLAATPLGADAAARNPVPVVAADGPQHWAYPTGWRFLGPFELLDETADVPYPETPDTAGMAYERRRLFTTRAGEVEDVTDACAWLPAGGEDALVAPPPVAEASAASLRYFTWYAATTLDSAVAQTVWTAWRPRGRVTVWLNDARVWDSGPRFESDLPALLKLPLRAGVNRLLVRCATSETSGRHFALVDFFDGYPTRPQGRADFTGFAFDICLAGAPGVSGYDRSGALPETAAARGYRGDGSGVAPPDADPPQAWDLERGINVAWRAALPPGLADPVPRAGTLFVMAEPNLLIALDAANGTERWRAMVGAEAGAPAEVNLRRPTAGVTPVVTDARVFAQAGSGWVAAFDHQGATQWQARAGVAWADAAMGSPLLTDGRLIVQTMLPGGGDGAYGLAAFDAADGRPLWTARGAPRRVVSPHERAAGLGNGLAVMRLANGAHRRTLIITGDGAVVDAADGRLWLRRIFSIEANRVPPLVVGDVVYVTPVLGAEAVRLWLDERGRVAARPLWINRHTPGRGQVKTVTQWGQPHGMKGPLAHDGLLYAVRVDKDHVPQHYPCPWTEVVGYDLRDGAVAVRQRAVLTEATDPTVAPLLAGGRLFVADGGDPVPGFGGTITHGQMAVVAPGRTPLVLARNPTGRMRAAPVCDGPRLYLRTYDGVVCLAVTNAAGRRYQSETLARTVIEEIGDRPPAPVLIEPAALPRPADDSGMALARLVEKQTPDAWLMAGPFAAGADPLDAAAVAALRPALGVRIGAGANSGAFVPAPARAMLNDARARGLDTAGAIGRRAQSITYYHTLLDCPLAGVYQAEVRGVGATVWLDGQPLREGDMVRFGVGVYPLLMRVQLGAIPAFMPHMAVEVNFKRVPDPAVAYAQWRERVRAHRALIERCAGEVADTPWAATLRGLMAHVAKP